MGDRLPAELLRCAYTAVSRVDDARWPAAQAKAPLASRDGNPPSSFSLASASSVSLTDNPRLDEAPAQHRELNMSFFVALRSSPAPIFVVDTEMQIVLWSRGAV
jgi:PAS domain-containing protein